MAATHLVSGDKLIKKGTLSGNRLHKHTITGTQVNLNKLGKVHSAKTADTAKTANSATNAGHASSADTASNAGTVGGVTVKGFSYQTPSSGTIATLFTLDGLTVTATCSEGNIEARTSVDHAYISSSWVTGTDTPARATDTDFNILDAFIANTTTGAETGSIEYVNPSGQRVSVSLQADMAAACTVSGHAFASG